MDIRADIYSLGCTLYHLLTGRAPFSGPNYKTPLNKVVGHARDTVPTVKSLRTAVPDDLSRIVERMMAKDPAARFATPAEVAATLAPFSARDDLAGLLTTSVLPPENLADAAPARLPLASSSPPWWRSRSTRIVAAALPLSLLLGITIYIATDNGMVKIEFSDPSANVNVKVDGQTIEIAGLEKPLRLRVGQHELVVVSGEFETVTRSFTVRRGDNPVLRVRLERIRDIVGHEPHQTPLHPAPAGQRPSGTPTAGQAKAIGPPLTFARPEVASVAYGQFFYVPAGWRLVAYKGNVYFAPWNDGTANPSKIFRYSPADGLKNGRNHTKLAETNGRFTTMKEMGGSLYYAASTGLIRKFDGTTISPITGSPLKATDYVTAMAELNGKQYFGTASGSIYEYNGSAWNKVYENQWSSPVSDLCAWKGSLFAGLNGDVNSNNGLAVKSNADVLAPTSWQTVISGVNSGSSLLLATPNYLYATPIDDVDSHSSTIRRSSNGMDFTTISGPGPFKFSLGNPLWSGARAYFFQSGGPNQYNNGHLVTDDGVTTVTTAMGDWPYRVLAATELNGQIYAIGLRGPYHVVGNVYLLTWRSTRETRLRGVH